MKRENWMLRQSKQENKQTEQEQIGINWVLVIFAARLERLRPLTVIHAAVVG